MKKILTLLFFCSSLTNYSQNLTLDELIGLRKKDIANVEEYLTTKGWEFLSSNEGTDGAFNKAMFTFNKSLYDDKADAFFTYLNSNSTGRIRINLQVHKLEKYNAYLARIKSYGCKLIDSSISDGEIQKVYQGATTTFMVSVETQKEKYSSSTKTTYQIFIIENSDYELNFSESE
jgi:hypothetical protein